MFKTEVFELTDDQKERGVIYSSRLICSSPYTDNSIIHEVYKDDPDKDWKITNLEDVSFFESMAKDMGWDVINEVRR